MNVNVTGYIILTGHYPEELAEKVNEHLKLGWQPLGGPFDSFQKATGYYRAGDVRVYAQAMTLSA